MKKSKYLTVLRLEKKRNDAKKKFQSLNEKAHKDASVATQAYQAMLNARAAVGEPGASGREDDAYYKAMKAYDKAYDIQSLNDSVYATAQRVRARRRLEKLNYQLVSELLPLGPVRRSKATKLRRSR